MDNLNKITQVYGPGEEENMVEKRIQEILDKSLANYQTQNHLEITLSCIDLTTLNPDDNNEVARRFSNNVNLFPSNFPKLKNVAAICCYPSIMEELKKNLTAPGVKLAVVGAGFPSSQTFLSVKLAECELLASKGADEIDVVISIGRFLEGDYQYVADEISLIKESIGNVGLKVILETGKLKTLENIRLASLLAMESGADFIKTSTGKETPAASPEAFYVMANAIKDYFRVTGKKVGIKPAGGIARSSDAIIYLTLLMEILGDEWCNPNLFRIGASRLANDILSKINTAEVNYF